MDALPLCGLLDDGPGLIPPGPSYMTPDPARTGEGRTLAIDAALSVLSRAAAGAYVAQLHLDDLAEVLDGSGPGVEPAVGEARVACTAARRSLRMALLAVAGLHDRLLPSCDGRLPPPHEPRRHL